jgi:alkanesulfonate monooxygenase SsuD/methylene tetrahydromethanopterin reductase-like flavin-dependent oxidoreductase (luciferase family)
MTKYGRRLSFGYLLLPAAADPKRPLRLAAQAETLGLDYVGVQDPRHQAAHLEPWTLLAAIGMTTARIGLVAAGIDLSLRSAARWAQATASLDLLTGGRVDVALGAGTMAEPAGTQGGDAPSTPEALAEAIERMRGVWQGARAADTAPGLAPAHPIGLWLHGQEPHLLALAGRLAGGWMPTPDPVAQPRDLALWSKQVDDAATAAGRAPSEIRRIWPIQGRIGNQQQSSPFAGAVDQWAAALAELAVEVGIDTFVLMEGEDAEVQLRMFALEVVPQTRARVEPAAEALSGLARAYQGAGASGATPAEEKTDEVDWVDETSMESFPASDPPASSSIT